MKKILILFSLLSLPFILFAQPNEQRLLQKLKEATDSNTRMNLYFELGKATVGKKAAKAKDYARKAHDLALEKRNTGMAAQTALLIARAYIKQRDVKNAEVWSKSAQKYGMQANDSDVIIKSVAIRSGIATKKRNYRRAYEINQEAFDYFSKKGTSITELEQQFEMQKLDLEREKEALVGEKARLKKEIKALSSDKEVLTAKQEELIQEKEKVEEEITNKEEELISISEEKEEAQALAQKREKEVKELTRDKLEQDLLLQEKKMALMVSETKSQRSRNLIIILLLVSGIIALLSILILSRFRSIRKARKTLETQNKLIEAERERSDELLLNILPAPIAEELKETGKASAKKYEETTVLFADFRNFTSVAEKLKPESLVRELDHCFKGFDYIISQYKDIEKIKTIGDAYMCASGLDESRRLPSNIVKAALEMQEFLEDYKKERQRLGLPFFEARIGLHTGPVVAGVVGVNKFAYDIWGSTVNVAARMEQSCDVGKVNISETTYNKVRYNFNCSPRGKVQAKNVGSIEMFYVNNAN